MANIHRQIVDFARLGLTEKAIAKVTLVPQAAVAVILRSPLAQAEVARGR